LSDTKGSLIRGVGVGILASIGGAVVLLVLGVIGVFFIGILQLAWILPIFFYLRRKGQTETSKGILVIAGIVALLNAACWGLVGNTNFH
jgi:hypothetical protein